MVYYFSGTGNSRHIARQIAQCDGEDPLAVTQHTPCRIPDDGKPVGLVTPVYFWGIPAAVRHFLEQLTLEGTHYTYLVLDCGGTTGDASGMAQRVFGRPFDAIYSIVMPDTYAPLFDVADADKVQHILQQSVPALEQILRQVAAQERGHFDTHRGLGKILTLTMYPLYRRKRTRTFRVSDACIGCGLCAQLCPEGHIQMHPSAKAGASPSAAADPPADAAAQPLRPRWEPAHCSLCLSCLHHCPRHAITFANSYKHGQYLHPDEREK